MSLQAAPPFALFEMGRTAADQRLKTGLGVNEYNRDFAVKGRP